MSNVRQRTLVGLSGQCLMMALREGGRRKEDRVGEEGRMEGRRIGWRERRKETRKEGICNNCLTEFTTYNFFILTIF